MLPFAMLYMLCLFMSSLTSADISASQVWRQQMLQNLLEPNREAELKRAQIQIRQLPPGFVGVRGKKFDKSKSKEPPAPGFLAVRGKKALPKYYNEETLHRYIRSELSKMTF